MIKPLFVPILINSRYLDAVNSILHRLVNVFKLFGCGVLGQEVDHPNFIPIEAIRGLDVGKALSDLTVLCVFLNLRLHRFKNGFFKLIDSLRLRRWLLDRCLFLQDVVLNLSFVVTERVHLLHNHLLILNVPNQMGEKIRAGVLSEELLPLYFYQEYAVVDKPMALQKFRIRAEGL